MERTSKEQKKAQMTKSTKLTPSRQNSSYATLSSPLCSPHQNRDILYQKYITKGMSAAQISKEFKCADTTIRRWLKKFGIPIRTNSKSKVGGKNHQWKGGKTLDKDGRVLVRKPSHPHARKNGYVFRAHLVMEKILGRYLKPEEVVHHENKKLDDDRPENLKLFISKSEHTSFHHHQRHKYLKFT